MSAGGYGRYANDPSHVGCPRARTDMTPCVARDGAPAAGDDYRCVGCDACPADLLRALVWEVTEPVPTVDGRSVFVGIDVGIEAFKAALDVAAEGLPLVIVGPLTATRLMYLSAIAEGYGHHPRFQFLPGFNDWVVLHLGGNT